MVRENARAPERAELENNVGVKTRCVSIVLKSLPRSDGLATS